MNSTDTDTDRQLEEPAEPEKLSLDVQVESPSACERHLTVTVSREDVDRYFDKEFSELMDKSAVPGFREGRAPRKLVEQRYRKEVTDRVKSSILMDSLGQITDEQSFSAISEPDFDFDAVELPDEGPMTFEFDLEVRPEFDAPQWKGLKLERPVRKFTKKDVDRQLGEVLRQNGTLVPHDGPAEADDFAVLNMRFLRDGKIISQVDEQIVCLKPILSFPDGNLQGFSALLEGATPRTTRQGKISISPDAAVEDLRGEEVDVEFELLEVKRLELPELSPGQLKQLGDFDSEGDLRDAVMESLERRLAYQQQRSIRQQITSQLTKTADWELPPDLLRRQAGRELERAMLELQSSGFSPEEIQAHENELRQNSMSSTAMALKEHFILERIAEDEEIDATDADYDVEIELIAAQSNEPPRRVRARLEKRGAMDALRNQIIERRVIGTITEHAEFKEVKAKPEENQVEAVQYAICGQVAAEIPSAKHGGEAEELRSPADRT